MNFSNDLSSVSGFFDMRLYTSTMNLINEIAKLESNNSNAFTEECQSSPSISNNHYENSENKLTELKPFLKKKATRIEAQKNFCQKRKKTPTYRRT